MLLIAAAAASSTSAAFYGVVDVGFGPVPKRMAFGLCYSQFLRIGTVSATETFLKEFDSGTHKYRQPHTTITFTTDATIRGPHSSEFEITVRGGHFEGSWYPVSSSDPQPRLGETYILAFHEIGSPPRGQPMNWPLDHKMVDATLAVAPDSKLPSVEAMREELRVACQEKMKLGTP